MTLKYIMKAVLVLPTYIIQLCKLTCAAFAEVKDALVADIGGTSTDVGVLIKGFPRPSSTKVQVGYRGLVNIIYTWLD